MVDIDDFDDVEEVVEDISEAEDSISGKDVDWLIKRGIKWLSGSEKDRAADERRARKERKEAEVHAAIMERERLRIAKLQKEIAALDEKKAITQSQAPISVLNPCDHRQPSIIYGSLPTPLSCPNIEALDASEEFKGLLHDIETIPSTIIILGGKGYGKSAQGHTLMERTRYDTGRPCVMFGVPQDRRKELPTWVGHVDRLEDIPRGAFALLDESGIAFFARNSGSDANKVLANVSALSRQNGLTLVFISQSARKLDISPMLDGDPLLIIKYYGDKAADMERREFRQQVKESRKIILKAAGLAENGVRLQDARLKPYSVWWYGELPILVKSEVCGYWSDEISNMFGALASSEFIETSQTIREQVMQLKSQGLTQEQIANKLGISQPTVSRVIQG